MAVNQKKSYKEQLLELYGQGQNTGGAAQQNAGTGQTGTAAPQTGQQSNAMLDLILSRKPFSYDSNADPAAQAARKEATRNAGLATRGTLGSYAGMTGGIPSTAAVSAAAQAGAAALQQGADKVAELKQLAYQSYQNEGTDMQNLYTMMQQQEATDYAKQQDEYQKQLAMAELKAAYGDYSGLKELGVDMSKYNAGGNGSYSYTPRVVDPTPIDSIPASVSDNWWMDYGGVLPDNVWAAAVAKYGEAAVNATGIRRQTKNGGQATRPDIALN